MIATETNSFCAKFTVTMTEIVTTQTPPILVGPSEKEKKYDRQLRLWAASGQAALESANILLFNTGSGTVGVETLKNLVLPGEPFSHHNRYTAAVQKIDTQQESEGSL